MWLHDDLHIAAEQDEESHEAIERAAGYCAMALLLLRALAISTACFRRCLIRPMSGFGVAMPLFEAEGSCGGEPRNRSEPAPRVNEGACRGVRGAKPLE